MKLARFLLAWALLALAVGLSFGRIASAEYDGNWWDGSTAGRQCVVNYTDTASAGRCNYTGPLDSIQRPYSGGMLVVDNCTQDAGGTYCVSSNGYGSPLSGNAEVHFVNAAGADWMSAPCADMDPCPISGGGSFAWNQVTGVPAIPDPFSPSAMVGPEYIAAAPEFCGAGVTTTDSLGRMVNNGDEVEFTIDVTPGQAREIDIAWGNLFGGITAPPPLGDSRWRRLYSSTNIGDPFTVTATVGGVSNGDVRLGSRWLRCYDDVADQLRYVRLDNADEVGGGYLRPCEVVKLYRPAGIFDVDDVVHIGLTYAGIIGPDQDPAISIVWGIYDPTDGWNPDIEYSETFNITGLGWYDGFDAVAGVRGTANQFVFGCVDEHGFYQTGDFKRGPTQIGSGPDDSAGGCLESSDIGINPVSWVPALVTMTACMTRAMFVPTDRGIGEVENAVEFASGKAPVSYIVEVVPGLVHSFDAAPGAVEDARDDCLTFMSGGLPGMTGETVASCPADLESSSLSGYRYWVGILAWFGLAWLIYGMTRELVMA